LIIKSLDAPYETSGKRINTWLKLKNIALSSGMRDTLDLVPIAAFYGKGNRTGLYGSFLMASYNSNTKMFESVCKLGTGFSWEQLQTLKLDPLSPDLEQ
jgi:DNA ligase 1